jgi:phage gp29-like protein
MIQRILNVFRSAPASTGQAGSLTETLQATNRWREQYNPLRSLTMDRAVRLLEAGERGEFGDLQWTYRFIEKRNATCRALISRRRSAILKLDWDIRLPSELPKGVLQAQADAQQQTLRAAYERIDNLKQAIRHLCLAEFRGFAHLQKHAGPDGQVNHLEPLDQWNWVRDGHYGRWAWNPDALTRMFSSFPATAIIDPDGFIIRECEMPIDEIALICFIRKNLSQKDWDGFIEIYGIPSGVVIMPPNIPQGKEEEFEASAIAISQGGGGALPSGSDYKANAEARGINPFRDHLRYQDEELVLAGTGGKLTMLTESGSGTLAGGAHEDTFDQIAEAEGNEISELFQEQFDAAILDAAHPGQPHLAYFSLASQPDEDVAQVVDNAVKLSGAGYVISAEELSEKTGFDLTPKADPQPQPGTPPETEDEPAPEPEDDPEDEPSEEPPIQNRLSEIVGVPETWLAPVQQFWAEIERKAADQTITQEDFARFLEQATARLPELFGTMDVAALAQTFEAGMTDGLITGARAGLRKHSTT